MSPDQVGQARLSSSNHKRVRVISLSLSHSFENLILSFILPSQLPLPLSLRSIAMEGDINERMAEEGSSIQRDGLFNRPWRCTRVERESR